MILTMHAAHRRPTIRRVRDWNPGSTIRPAASQTCAPRPTAPTQPDPWWMFREEDIATLVPKTSEIRALLGSQSDSDETVPYVRPVVDLPPPTRRSPVQSTPDIALHALVEVYEKRADQLAKDRAHALAIVAQACANDDDLDEDEEETLLHERARQRQRRPMRMKPFTPRASERARELLRVHGYKIIFTALCLWGTLHLLLVR